MMLLTKRKRDNGEKQEKEEINKVGTSIVLPIRQTASIFRQSVTVVRNHEKSQFHTEVIKGSQDKPKQVFWEKRLEGLSACDKNGKVIETSELPSKIKAVGLQLGDDTILRSIATALYINGHPITGQNKPKSLLDKSPGVYINPTQPLVLGLHVTDEDIALQEKKVLEARERLKEALNE